MNDLLRLIWSAMASFASLDISLSAVFWRVLLMALVISCLEVIIMPKRPRVEWTTGVLQSKEHLEVLTRADAHMVLSDPKHFTMVDYIRVNGEPGEGIGATWIQMGVFHKSFEWRVPVVPVMNVFVGEVGPEMVEIVKELHGVHKVAAKIMLIFSQAAELGGMMAKWLIESLPELRPGVGEELVGVIEEEKMDIEQGRHELARQRVSEGRLVGLRVVAQSAGLRLVNVMRGTGNVDKVVRAIWGNRDITELRMILAEYDRTGEEVIEWSALLRLILEKQSVGRMLKLYYNLSSQEVRQYLENYIKVLRDVINRTEAVIPQLILPEPTQEMMVYGNLAAMLAYVPEVHHPEPVGVAMKDWDSLLGRLRLMDLSPNYQMYLNLIKESVPVDLRSLFQTFSVPALTEDTTAFNFQMPSNTQTWGSADIAVTFLRDEFQNLAPSPVEHTLQDANSLRGYVPIQVIKPVKGPNIWKYMACTKKIEEFNYLHIRCAYFKIDKYTANVSTYHPDRLLPFLSLIVDELDEKGFEVSNPITKEDNIREHMYGFIRNMSDTRKFMQYIDFGTRASELEKIITIFSEFVARLNDAFGVEEMYSTLLVNTLCMAPFIARVIKLCVIVCKLGQTLLYEGIQDIKVRMLASAAGAPLENARVRPVALEMLQDSVKLEFSDPAPGFLQQEREEFMISERRKSARVLIDTMFGEVPLNPFDRIRVIPMAEQLQMHLGELEAAVAPFPNEELISELFGPWLETFMTKWAFIAKNAMVPMSRKGIMRPRIYHICTSINETLVGLESRGLLYLLPVDKLKEFLTRLAAAGEESEVDSVNIMQEFPSILDELKKRARVQKASEEEAKLERERQERMAAEVKKTEEAAQVHRYMDVVIQAAQIESRIVETKAAMEANPYMPMINTLTEDNTVLDASIQEDVQTLKDYSFVDPNVIQGYTEPEAPGNEVAVNFGTSLASLMLKMPPREPPVVKKTPLVPVAVTTLKPIQNKLLFAALEKVRIYQEEKKSVLAENSIKLKTVTEISEQRKEQYTAILTTLEAEKAGVIEQLPPLVIEEVKKMAPESAENDVVAVMHTLLTTKPEVVKAVREKFEVPERDLDTAIRNKTIIKLSQYADMKITVDTIKGFSLLVKDLRDIGEDASDYERTIVIAKGILKFGTSTFREILPNFETRYNTTGPPKVVRSGTARVQTRKEITGVGAKVARLLGDRGHVRTYCTLKDKTVYVVKTDGSITPPPDTWDNGIRLWRRFTVLTQASSVVGPLDEADLLKIEADKFRDDCLMRGYIHVLYPISQYFEEYTAMLSHLSSCRSEDTQTAWIEDHLLDHVRSSHVCVSLEVSILICIDLSDMKLAYKVADTWNQNYTSEYTINMESYKDLLKMALGIVVGLPEVSMLRPVEKSVYTMEPLTGNAGGYAMLTEVVNSLNALAAGGFITQEEFFKLIEREGPWRGAAKIKEYAKYCKTTSKISLTEFLRR